MSELGIALFFESFGPFILVGLLILGVFALRRMLREARSRKALAGDETARSIERTRTAAWIVWVVQIVSYPVVFVLTLAAGGGFGVALFVAIMIGLLFYLWAQKLRGRYNQEFKENIVSSLLKETFDNLRYLPDGRLDDKHLWDTNFFHSQSRMSGNDLIEADYAGKHFAQCDLVVEERYTTTSVDNDGVTTTQDCWRDVFRGRMMRFDLASAFRSGVQVVRWNFDAAKTASSPGSWKKVETELHDFNKTFGIYAEDPADAMTVLTPQMIEGIFRLDHQLNLPLALLFIDRSIYAFFPSARDAFDVSGKAKKTLLEERELLRGDIRTVTGFLDAMEYGMRDNRTFMAQIRPPEPARAEASASAAPVAGSVPKPERPPLPAQLEDPARQFGSYKGKKLLLRLWRNPALILLAAYYISVVYALNKLPSQFGVGIHIVDGEVTLSQHIPTIVFLAAASFLVTRAALAVGRGPWTRNLIQVVILVIYLLVYWFFVSNNFAAHGM